jgi:hypothetical protein
MPSGLRRIKLAILTFSFVFLASTSLRAASPPSADQPSQKVVIDSDPGTDDALAILLAVYSPELDVKGISIVAGNVTADMGYDDALRVLSLANRCDIPVAKGAEHPLLQRLVTEPIGTEPTASEAPKLLRVNARAIIALVPISSSTLFTNIPTSSRLFPSGPSPISR